MCGIKKLKFVDAQIRLSWFQPADSHFHLYSFGKSNQRIFRRKWNVLGKEFTAFGRKLFLLNVPS